MNSDLLSMTRVLEFTFQWILSFLGIRKSRVSHHLDEVITVIEPAFDREWYVAQDPEISRSGLDPVAHYVLLGAERGLDPHPGFSTSRYLQRREDVRTSGMNPDYHWLRFGQSEGREHSAPDRTQEWSIRSGTCVAMRCSRSFSAAREGLETS